MKKLLLVTLLLAFAGQAEAGHKKMAMNIPLPRPIPVEKIAGVKGDLLPPPMFVAQNPDPFKTQAQPGQTVQVPNPPAGSPVNINIPPVTQAQPDNFLQYLWMLVASVVGAMFGIPQLKTAFGSQPLQLDASHPEVKKAIHDGLVHLIQSGVLQAPVQAGLGMIPGVGGLLAGLEPTAKQVVLKILAGQDPTGAVASTPAPIAVSGLPDELFKKIEALIESKLKGVQP